MTHAAKHTSLVKPILPDVKAGVYQASFGMRVYIAKITFTTLIDHFTSLDAESSLVLSDQLIKLELLTQSIRQQKLPPHMRAVCGIRPGCPYGLGRRAGHGGGRILLRKDSEDHSN